MVAFFNLWSRSFATMNDNYQELDENKKDDFLKALGQQIKKIREEKGIKAAEFGRRAFMERSHVARLEGGHTNPTATTLRLVCKALEIELDELFKDFKLD